MSWLLASPDAPPGNASDVLPNWWTQLDNNLEAPCDCHGDDYRPYACYWYYLALAYGVIAFVAAAQLIRIQQRVPDYGWTTQKVFHLLNVLFCVLRAASFALYTLLDELKTSPGNEDDHQVVVKLVVFDLPGLLFFTTFTLLVLFWAEIYHQASNVDTKFLRPYFIKVNALVYVVEIILWGLSTLRLTHDWARYASAGFLTAVSLGAVLGFLVYGCRLFSMLRQFPIESRGRRKKLQEVGLITAICSACFFIRALLSVLYILDDRDFDVDLMQNALLNIVFYAVCEILAAVLVLFILHRLPPKHKPLRQRAAQGGDYQPVPASEEGRIPGAAA